MDEYPGGSVERCTQCTMLVPSILTEGETHVCHKCKAYVRNLSAMVQRASSLPNK